ncbi:MAG: hypothetical protein B7Z55_09200, partial [Planctomycetales bacterium 12-60-4]
MQLADIHQLLLDRFGSDRIVEMETQAKDPWIVVAPAAIRDVCLALRDDPQTEFDTINDLCGVDYPTEAERFEVVYHMLS